MSETKHYKIYKPFGMLSQLTSNDPKEIRSKTFLSKLYDFPEGVMPIGRLDAKSEGLLLMTTDGKLSDTINRSGVEKEYWVQLDGIISPEAIQKLMAGIEIGLSGSPYLTKPCKVNLLVLAPKIPLPDSRLRIGRHRPTSWISICITEGKFRQIRKMTAAVGFPTLRLIRNRIGTIYLNDLIPGEVKNITIAADAL
ncbi:MAG: pseudouridine synthase [Flavobacteriales bacterium]|nr:pseudouridine synthase [Flavobacteriales bacterium]